MSLETKHEKGLINKNNKHNYESEQMFAKFTVPDRNDKN